MPHDDTIETDRLLFALGEGDQTALDELLRLHGAYLKRIIQLRIAPELHTRVDASDVVQETQLVVMQRIDEFIRNRPASFRVWLRSRALEKLAELHRRHIGAAMRSVRREHSPHNSSSMTIARALISDTPSKLMRQHELAARVRDLIDSLNTNDREILWLRHVEGLSNSEAAEAVNIEPATARKRYGRAVKRFVEKMAETNMDIQLLWGDTG